MAGYEVSSFNWPAFQQFVAEPTDKQLKLFAKHVSREYQCYADDYCEEDDLAHYWRSDNPDSLSKIAGRLKRDEWYSDLTNGGKTIWDFAVSGFVSKCQSFHCRGETQIYWDVIDICEKSVRDKRNCEPVISRFGKTPFRFHTSARGGVLPPPDVAAPPRVIENSDAGLQADNGLGAWFAYHSMHSPDEVRQMIEELESAEQVIEASRDPQMRGDYENALLPALDRIVEKGRGLMVINDT